MKRYEKIPSLLVAVGLLAVALPQYAKASDIDDLNAKVQQLTTQVDQLKAKQDAADAAKPGAPTTVKQGIWRPWGTPSYPNPGPAVNNGPLSAQIFGTTFTVYGNVDIYANQMRSSSGHSFTALEDGAIQRSRWGIKGDKPVAPGYEIKFNLETGFNTLNGKFADAPAQPTGGTGAVYSGRLFDRQAWVGLLTPIGEFRVGRQNATIQQLGGEIDFAGRNLGGVINYFGVPSRYDSDVSFLSTRFSGFSFQVHYALAGTAVANGTNGNLSEIGNQKVWQAMVDYKQGPFTAGYMQIVAAPPAAGTQAAVLPFRRSVVYENPYVNYDYGKGKVWFSTVHSNNNGINGALFNTGAPLSNTGVTGSTINGTLNTGTDADVNTFYNIYQGSASYIVTDKLVIGGLYGWIRDITHHVKNNHGYALGAFYDVWKDTHTYFMYDVVKNDAGAGFVQAASAGLSPNFSAANDVNGRTITGVQAGVMYVF